MSKKSSMVLTVLFCVAASGFLFLFPDISTQSIISSAERCVTSLLPSLFPMMIISRQLAGMISFGGGRFSECLEALTGFPKPLLPVFFIGLLCGYPIPAIIAKNMYDSGKLTPDHTRTAFYLCNNASPAFLSFFVGRVVFSSVLSGFVLFISQCLAVITLAHFFKSTTRYPTFFDRKTERISDSISRATDSILKLFGFVIFFSLIADMAIYLLGHTHLPKQYAPLISGFFEITSGIGICCELKIPLKVIACCFLCGMGGLSVYFQLSSVAGDNDIITPQYFICRFFISVLTLFYFSSSTFLLNTIYKGSAAW